MQSSTKILLWAGLFWVIVFSVFLIPEENKTLGLIWLLATIISFLNIFFQIIYLGKKDPEGIKPKKIDWKMKSDFTPHAWKIKQTLVIWIVFNIVAIPLTYFFLPEKFTTNYLLFRSILGLISLYILLSLFPGLRYGKGKS